MRHFDEPKSTEWPVASQPDTTQVLARMYLLSLLFPKKNRREIFLKCLLAIQWKGLVLFFCEEKKMQPRHRNKGPRHKQTSSRVRPNPAQTRLTGGLLVSHFGCFSSLGLKGGVCFSARWSPTSQKHYAKLNHNPFPGSPNPTYQNVESTPEPHPSKPRLIETPRPDFDINEAISPLSPDGDFVILGHACGEQELKIWREIVWNI